MSVLQRTDVNIGGGVRKKAHWPLLLPGHRMATVAKTPLLVALGAYFAGAKFEAGPFILTALLAAALWAVLYALNEAYDLAIESKYIVSVRKKTVLYVLLLSLIAGSALVSPLLFALFLAMSLGQMAYCAPPVRLKRYWWAAPLLSGAVNPTLRLLCGATLGTHAIPLLAVGSIAGIHLSSAIRTRSLLRGRDRGYGYKVVPAAMERLGAVSMIAGFLGTVLMCFEGILPTTFIPLVVIAMAFAAYAYSGKVDNIAQLRRGWLWFALLTVAALASLYFSR